MEVSMKRYVKVAAITLALVLIVAGFAAAGGGKKKVPGEEEILIYMQMGGTQGDGATLARTNGARAAAEALGNVKLIEQYSQWQAEKMIAQFKEALAANPAGIVIMGHPGEAAFAPLVKQAVDRGIIVTSGNAPLPGLEQKYGPQGFGYAGVDLYKGGYMTGQQMVAMGNLKAGDKAVVYGLFSQPGRKDSPQGMYDALTDAGLKVEKLEISPEVDADSSLAIPVLTAYLERNPDVKTIGTQHGAVTSIMPNVMKALDQVLYLQGYIPVSQVVMMHRYKIPGLHINTAAGVVTPENIGGLKDLIEQGIR